MKGGEEGNGFPLLTMSQFCFDGPRRVRPALSTLQTPAMVDILYDATSPLTPPPSTPSKWVSCSFSRAPCHSTPTNTFHHFENEHLCSFSRWWTWNELRACFRAPRHSTPTITLENELCVHHVMSMKLIFKSTMSLNAHQHPQKWASCSFREHHVRWWTFSTMPPPSLLTPPPSTPWNELRAHFQEHHVTRRPPTPSTTSKTSGNPHFQGGGHSLRHHPLLRQHHHPSYPGNGHGSPTLLQKRDGWWTFSTDALISIPLFSFPRPFAFSNKYFITPPPVQHNPREQAFPLYPGDCGQIYMSVVQGYVNKLWTVIIVSWIKLSSLWTCVQASRSQVRIDFLHSGFIPRWSISTNTSGIIDRGRGAAELWMRRTTVKNHFSVHTLLQESCLLQKSAPDSL